MNEQETAAGLPQTPGYQYARQVGQQLFVSGQVPNDGDGTIVGVGDPAVQAEQCLLNLQKLLSIHDFTTKHIQQLVIHVVGERSNLTRAWEVVEAYFSGQVPPATLLGVPVLGYADQLVEIDATIIKP
ncbi:RidA family protein [Marinicella sediminis]|uniref:RidA family protein n=1 Tax=Marinicella sediminis TaxID=1792834 RepID=A0ABV7JB09_9GAMM|nr:RidA family protein [Marinicella sediminis]